MDESFNAFGTAAAGGARDRAAIEDYEEVVGGNQGLEILTIMDERFERGLNGGKGSLDKRGLRISLDLASV